MNNMFFYPLDDEETRKAMDRVEASSMERRNRYFRLMEEMKPEDLATLREIFATSLMVESPVQFVVHLIGEIDAIMRLKHGDSCGSCGRVHTTEMIDAEKAKMEAEQKATDRETEDSAAMSEYNVIRKDDGSLACGGCGAPIPSLADRMLRRPGIEGCPFCVEHQKWG